MPFVAMIMVLVLAIQIIQFFNNRWLVILPFIALLVTDIGLLTIFINGSNIRTPAVQFGTNMFISGGITAIISVILCKIIDIIYCKKSE